MSGLLLTTEAVIADAPEKEKAPTMPPGGGMEWIYFSKNWFPQADVVIESIFNQAYQITFDSNHTLTGEFSYF